ncbi:MAG TPA: DUF3426 domain-containing protein [Steroidobacteraceae bacterium]
MFTQCSKCETIFRLSAEVLRAAGGQVRCGRCGEVFNALARLAEDATAFTKGESPLDLETRADEILQSLEAVAPADTAPPPAADQPQAAEPQVEIAHLEVLDPVDDELASEASLEFTLPPGELDRIFVETPLNALQRLAAEGHRALRTSDESAALPPAVTAMPAVTAAPAATAAPATAAPVVPSAAVAAAAAAAAASVSRAGAPQPTRIGLEVSDDVRREMLANYAHAELPDINAPRRQVPFAAWVSAAAVLSLLLVTQVIRSNGEWLATHAPGLGLGAATAASLSAYQLRQWGVTGDPAAKGTLRVRASIMNSTAQLQPYPLLRVTLANRFGTRVGKREFEPAEYLGKATARMLAPGERVDATLDILDPGKDAEGFEIDVCVRGADRKILCAGDAAGQAK